MTQLTINIENPKMLAPLKKILNALEGISIAKAEPRRRRCGLDEALEDVRKGRVYSAESVDDMFQQILGDKYVPSHIL